MPEIFKQKSEEDQHRGDPSCWRQLVGGADPPPSCCSVLKCAPPPTKQSAPVLPRARGENEPTPHVSLSCVLQICTIRCTTRAQFEPRKHPALREHTLYTLSTPSEKRHHTNTTRPALCRPVRPQFTVPPRRRLHGIRWEPTGFALRYGIYIRSQAPSAAAWGHGACCRLA